jgi:hypothetical protein
MLWMLCDATLAVSALWLVEDDGAQGTHQTHTTTTRGEALFIERQEGGRCRHHKHIKNEKHNAPNKMGFCFTLRGEHTVTPVSFAELCPVLGAVLATQF